MSEIGFFTLSFAWITALYGVIVGFWGAKKNKLSLFLSAQRASFAIFWSLFAAISCLAASFLTNDYSNQCVWQFSNRDMEWYYKITAIWGGMDGSILLWAFIASTLSALAVLITKPKTEQDLKIAFWAAPALMINLLFFISLCLFITNPFRYIRSPFIPPDGNGLNPLLQNPLMAIHPPMLYLGFTTLAIPFGFTLGSLLANNYSSYWLTRTRIWSLLGWLMLTIGIVLGGLWAYVELGWGGFWAWDPVENASFLPWLTVTAYIHSVMIEERKAMMRRWNIWLVILSYGLTVFGTFLTRSGVVQSVHAFASTDVGWVFLLYLGVIFSLCVYLTIRNNKSLRSTKYLESILSRETAFLLNNLIFLSIMFAILWGVLFPIFSELVTGAKQSIGIPFYNAINTPLFLALIFLMGVGPLIAWRKSSLASLRKTFLKPFSFALLLGILLIFAGVINFYPTLSYSISFFVLGTIISEFYRGVKAQKQLTEKVGNIKAAYSLFKKHSLRYLGYLVHFGVVIVTVAITASMAHKIEDEFELTPSESYSISKFKLTLNEYKVAREKNFESLIAKVTVKDRKTGEILATLTPESRFYYRNKEQTTEVALRSTLLQDLYLVLAGVESATQNNKEELLSFKLYINPLQIWLWIGALIMALATIGILVIKRNYL
ncbi:MAG TPA: heme lyase CcmF/NrfE family subunit [Oligoflexia bacterium]|nr:heme lyase CcmF/NrfE family subunit [Oligoflexia bacterium]HMP27403.1 heme lyase CcmF/NrfE family subunit [Oligoflexia bacterium]